MVKMETDSKDKNNSELHSDHTYSQLNRSASDHQELKYADFKSDLNQRIDLFESTCIDYPSIGAVEQPLKKQPAKTSKYFKAYPEIYQQNALVFYKKNTQLKNAPLLQNGSRCPALVMEGRTYFLRNTCAFDSIIQILRTAAIDNIEYRQFLQSSNNSTLKFVCNFITKGISKNLLINRAQILAEFCKPQPQLVVSYKIYADNNIANTVKIILSSNPSLHDIEACSVCAKRTITHVTIAPDHKIINKKGFKALQEALEFNSTPLYNITCDCLGKYTRIRTTSEHHVFIELDVRDRQDLKKSLRCLLRDFPTVLHLGQKNQATSPEYRLAGVVEHMPGHYIAHCLRIGGYWQKFNDLDRKVMSSTAKTPIEPHLALYIRKNNGN